MGNNIDIIEGMLAVWEAIGDWIIVRLSDMQAVFWNAGVEGGVGSLTFLGVLAVATVGIGFVFLLIGVIQNFIKFRS